MAAHERRSKAKPKKFKLRPAKGAAIPLGTILGLTMHTCVLEVWVIGDTTADVPLLLPNE